MKSFVKVVDSGNFSAAARALNKSPGQVTTQIQLLEEQLGVRLLNRTTRKTSMTEVGRNYYARCAQILAELDEADRSVQALQSAPRGKLRLNVSAAISLLMTPAIGQFLMRYPDVSVELTMTDRMVDLVGEHFDLAICDAPVTNASFISRRLATYRLLVCGSPDYLARRGTPQRPADLVDHDCLCNSNSGIGSDWQFDGSQGSELISVSGPLRGNCGLALRYAAVHGQGLYMVPSFFVADELKAGRLISVLDEFLKSQHAINIVYPHRDHLSAKVRCFIDELAAHFSGGSGRVSAEQIPVTTRIFDRCPRSHVSPNAAAPRYRPSRALCG
jgi:DNA-binding transcriptional LysR family regulator